MHAGVDFTVESGYFVGPNSPSIPNVDFAATACTFSGVMGFFAFWTPLIDWINMSAAKYEIAMSEEIVVPGLYASIAAFILSNAGLDH